MAQLIIQANEEGQQAIKDLCHAALKIGGLNNLKPVVHILNSIQPLAKIKPELIADPPQEEAEVVEGEEEAKD